MSGRPASSSSRWRSGSSGPRSSSEDRPRAPETARRLIVFLLTFALVWSFLQFLVWPGAQPLYSGLVASASNAVLAITEAGRPVTTLSAKGAFVHVHSGLSADPEPVTSWSGNILHFYLVVFVSLILVYPGLKVERRLKLLVGATAGLFLFHVAAMLIKVEYLYAVEVEGLGARYYTPAELAIYEWLHENTIFLAVQLVPATAIVLMMVLATFEKHGRPRRMPARRRPADRRRRNWILTGCALGVAVVSFTLLDWKVWARQSETETRLGFERLDRHDTEEARGLFLSALERAPGSNRAQLGLGICTAQEGDLSGAARKFEAILASDPEIPEALLQLGLALHHMDDHLGAVDPLGRYHAIRPEDEEGAYYLAVSLGRLGRHGETEAILRRALRDNPDAPRLLMELTRTLMLTGRGCSALSYVQRLARMDLTPEQGSLVDRTLVMLEDRCVGGD